MLDSLNGHNRHDGSNGRSDNRSLQGFLLTTHLFDERLLAKIGQMAMHDEEGVDYAGNDKQAPQPHIEKCLEGLSAKQHGYGRKDDREQITHSLSPVNVPASLAQTVSA